MIIGVADTHAAVWYLFDDNRLSAAAGDFIDQAAAAGRRVVISVISLAEVIYLVKKSRLPASAYVELKAALSDDSHVLIEAAFTAEIVEAMRCVSRGSRHQSGRPYPGFQSANRLVRAFHVLGRPTTIRAGRRTVLI
jgi:PIN domain nuclease of toxin-antitoxin system